MPKANRQKTTKKGCAARKKSYIKRSAKTGAKAHCRTKSRRKPASKWLKSAKRKSKQPVKKTRKTPKRKTGTKKPLPLTPKELKSHKMLSMQRSETEKRRIHAKCDVLIEQMKDLEKTISERIAIAETIDDKQQQQDYRLETQSFSVVAERHAQKLEECYDDLDDYDVPELISEDPKTARDIAADNRRYLKVASKRLPTTPTRPTRRQLPNANGALRKSLEQLQSAANVITEKIDFMTDNPLEAGVSSEAEWDKLYHELKGEYEKTSEKHNAQLKQLEKMEAR